MNIKKLAYVSLILACTILIGYLIILSSNKYLFNFHESFSLDTASKMAPFVSAFVGIFLTFASTLLIIENLNLTNNNNAENQILTQKNQFESIYFNLLSQQRQIKDSIIKTSVEFTLNDGVVLDTLNENFFDNLALRINIDSEKQNTDKTDDLVALYNHWFTIYNSELGHYFRHLYHIVNFVDKNSYFILSRDKNYLKKYDYIKILRAQISNSELVLLSLNALSNQGNEFKPLVEKYKLLKNINLETDLHDDYLKRVPYPDLIIANFKHIQ